MKVDPQWISAIAASIGCISLVIIIWQVKVNQDKSRREKAIDIIIEFGKLSTKDIFRHKGFIFDLAKADVRKVQQGEKISVKRDIVKAWFPELVENNTQKDIQLGVDLVLDIRATMVKLLNGLEVVALAYKHGVVDRYIIDECFQEFLFMKGFLPKCKEFTATFGGGWRAVDELPSLMMSDPKFRNPPA